MARSRPPDKVVRRPEKGHGGRPIASSHAELEMRATSPSRSWHWLWREKDPTCPPHSPPSYGKSRSPGHRPAAVALLGPCLVTAAILSLLVPSVSAAFITFENCLDQGIINSNPIQLQFIPLNLTARLETANASHNLNVTVFGTVAGSSTTIPPPPPEDPQWKNPNETLGKIVDVSEPNNKYSTLFTRLQFLGYTPYQPPASPFCTSLVHGTCPLGPAFGVNSADLSRLPAFSVAHQLYSSYAFATITTTLRVRSGDASNVNLGCVSAQITPDLGASLANLLAFIPLAILVLVGIATVSAAIFSPWGSADIFRWTTNYGRDADLLRLVTPGFGDCLQYIQFAFLTGALSLNYPGFYQPVISQVGWSVLMFNTSFVTHGNGTQSLQDGIYVTNGTYGLDRMRQLVGMSSVKDIWAGVVIWLLVIMAAVVALTQAGFLMRWVYRHISHIQEEDLRAKNLPFTIGNVIRIVFNYFLLPLMALSMFQLVVAKDPPHEPVDTALAVILLLVLLGFAGWLLRLLSNIRPRSYLFDDLPTVLLYGPLYNTYSDDAAPFTMIPLFLQLVRGVAIGAVQPSGIAQLVLLAVCEVIYLLTLHAFRPFHSPTSMNAYHTFFAAARLLTTLLSVTFVPSLGITEGPKGWIGYVILIIHAIVLVFFFLLNAIQTVVEVAARRTGAGGESIGGGPTRGGLVKIFGMRQLSRRVPRHDGAGRRSVGSDATFLSADRGQPLRLSDGRPRSASGSSTVLLNRHLGSEGRASVGLDSASGLGGTGHNRSTSGSAYTPTTPGAASPFSYIPTEAQDVGPTDPYYRPPRARRPTIEGPSPSARSRISWVTGDWANKRWSQVSRSRGEHLEAAEGPSPSGRGTPVPAYLASRELSEVNVNDPRRPRTDYAVREVDYYYGVRGPALSNLPSRRLGTGPADPTGPIASAGSWLKGFFGGKTKEKGKGFEVVRSSRVPLSTGPRALPDVVINGRAENYRDDGAHGRERSARDPRSEVPLVDIENTTRADEPRLAESGEEDDRSSLHSGSGSDGQEGGLHRTSQVSPLPPSLPRIDTGGGIELPSRIGSKASSRPSQSGSRRIPKVPRKSSKRNPAVVVGGSQDATRLSAIRASPPASPGLLNSRLHDLPDSDQPNQLSGSSSPRMPFESEHSSVGENGQSADAESRASSMLPPLGGEGNVIALEQARASSSLSGAHHRQTSVGFVPQHRASDSIHRVRSTDPGSVDLNGSTAEIVDDGPVGRASSGSRPY